MRVLIFSYLVSQYKQVHELHMIAYGDNEICEQEKRASEAKMVFNLVQLFCSSTLVRNANSNDWQC